MLKKVFLAIALPVFIAHNTSADGRGEFDNFVNTIVATGNRDKYCSEIATLCKQSLKDPAFTMMLQETGIPIDKIESLKKHMKKVVKSIVGILKIECDLRADNNPGLFAAQNALRFLVLANSPYAQEMKKKWEALENEMKNRAQERAK
jgi:hypothetical protein